jgi:hypothetical protein
MEASFVTLYCVVNQFNQFNQETKHSLVMIMNIERFQVFLCDYKIARKCMPRLVGKKNNSILYTGLAMLIAAAGVVALEYFGVIDFAPNFGKDAEVRDNSTSQPVRTNKPVYRILGE